MTTTPAAVVEALTDLVVRFLRVEPKEATPDRDLTDLGLDSIQAVEIAAALGDRLGITIDEGVFYDHHTIAEVAAAVAGDR